MSEGLAVVITSSLERLREGLHTGRIKAPLTRADLVAFSVKEQLGSLTAALEGHSRAACLAILEAVIAERVTYDRPTPELVWTGPEGGQASARDTAVVLRELFEGAHVRVVLAGYSFRDAEAVLSPLSAVMKARGVRSHFFIDVKQVEEALADPEAHGQEMLGAFINDNWPFGPPYPELFCDRRALRRGPPWCSLHAKCVAVDGERALVSSANFTERGQDRNIETGVLLHDAGFAAQLERQWMSLVEEDLVFQWRGQSS